MRFLRLLLLCVGLSFSLFYFGLFQPASAATGTFKQINFQGKVVNKTTGTNIANNSYTFIFTIYDAASGGSTLWTETKSVTVTNGIFQTLLGSDTALPASIDFNTDNIYLGIEFNGDGEMSPRVRFAAVPQAFNAQKVAGLTVTDTTGTLTIPNGATIAFAGAYTTTFTSTNTTSITLPTSGTLATLAGSEELTNKTIGSTGLVFSGAGTDIDAATGQGLTFQGRAASSFDTTSGNLSFQIAGTGTTAVVQIGAGGVGGTTPDYLALDVKSDTGDPANGAEGYMYYNTADNKFRCYQNSGWTDCIGVGAPGSSNWTDGSGIIYPNNATLDLFIGGLATSSAKFAFINVNSGIPTASIAGNLALAAPTGADPATKLNVYNGGSFGLQTSVGGDAGLTERLTVLNNGNVGIGTTSPVGHLHIGAGGLETTTEPKIIVSELIDDSLASNPHSFVDVSRVNRNGNIAMASFDASPTFIGTYDYLHYAAHKSRLFYQSSGTMARYYGYYSDLNMTDSTGEVTNAYRYYGQDATDTSGNATILNNYGVYIEPLTKGTDGNFAIYTSGATKSYFGGNVGIGTTAPSEMLNIVGNELITAGSLADQRPALKITGTLPGGTVSAYNTVVNVQATSQNSTSNAYPFNMDLLAGATDARVYAAGRFSNAVAGTGTGTTLWSGVANSGLIAAASGNTAGFNFGGRFTALNGNQSVGVEGSSITTKNSGTNIGVIGYGLNAGTSPIQIGGYFGLQSAPPTFASAALIADNGATASPIFLGRDNGSSVFVINDGGNVGIGSTAPGALLQLGTAGTSLGTFRLTGNTGGYVQLQPSATAGDWTLTLPVNDGDDTQVLTTNGSGVTSWGTVTGGSGANTTLSNLGVVAINTSLISDTDSTDDLGSSSKYWANTYTDQLFTTGNVGIGSTAPETSLDVVGSMGIRSGGILRLYTSGNSNYNVIYSTAANLYMNSGNGEVITQAVSNIDFQTWTASSYNSKMTITNAGNVGIGTSNPLKILDVRGSATISGTLQLAPNVQVDAGTCDASAKGKQYFDGTANMQYVCNGTAWTQMSVAFTAADGAGVSSSGSGLEFGTSGFGLIQGCADTEVLKWNEGSSIWECKPSTYSKFVSTAVTNIVTSTGNTSSVTSTNVDVDAVIGAASSATQVLVQLRVTATNSTAANWSGHVMPTGNAVNNNNGVVWTGELDGAGVGYGMAIVALDANKVFSWGLTEIAGTSTGTLEINVVGYWTPVTTGADLAENYYGSSSIEAGDLVSLDPSLAGGVVKSLSENPNGVIGIVSSQPGMVLDEINNPNQAMTIVDSKYLGRVPIAVGLVGRVPVKVTTENGPITAGDPITISSLPGIGMKATQPGVIVGRALENYSNSDPTAVGQVLVFLNLDHNEPLIALDDFGDLILTQNDNSEYQVISQATPQASPLANYFGAFTKTITAISEAGLIKTKELKVSDTAQIADLSVTNLSINGQTLREYVESVIAEASSASATIATTSGSAWLAEVFQHDQYNSQPTMANISTQSSNDLEITLDATGQLVISGNTTTQSLTTQTITFIDPTNASGSATIVMDNLGSAGLEINSGSVGKAGLKLTMLANNDQQIASGSGRVLGVDREGNIILVDNPTNNEGLEPTTILASQIEGLEVALFDATASGELRINRQSFFSAFVEFIQTVIFRGEVNFLGKTYFAQDMAGTALIVSHEQVVDVTFDTPYEFPPIVTISYKLKEATESAYLNQSSRAAVSNVTEQGFSIVLEQPTTREVEFAWVAIAVKEPKQSRGTIRVIPSPAPTPEVSQNPIPTVTLSPTLVPSVTDSPSPTNFFTPTVTLSPSVTLSPGVTLSPEPPL